MSLPASQKRILNSFNPLFCVLFVIALVLLRTFLESLGWSWVDRWDVLLAFAIYIGQRRSLVEGLIVTLFVSHVLALNAVAPMGVLVTHYVILFLGAHALGGVLYASSRLSVLTMLFVFAILSRFLYPILASMLGQSWPMWSWYNLSLFYILLNALVGWLIYMLLISLDRWTYKDLEGGVALSGDRL